MVYLIRLLAILMMTGSALAEQYQSPEQFVAKAFSGAPPAARVLWFTPAQKEQIRTLIGHPPYQLRQRYWLEGQRSVWVVEEIGKEKPITCGFIIRDGEIDRVEVLIFRESRGWEVRHDFFTRQFLGASLTEQGELDQRIDGISGATLSVNALSRLARLVLYLHTQVVQAEEQK